MTESKSGYVGSAKRRLSRRLREEETLLAAMRRGVAYGYDLSRVTRLRPGRLYPALRRLESDGVIVGTFEEGPEPRRRFYKIASARGNGRVLDDPKARRLLCTGLVEIIHEHAPDDADVVDLAEHTPSLTATEVEAIRAYFRGATDA